MSFETLCKNNTSVVKERILKSFFFDDVFYREEYKLNDLSSIDCVAHYLDIGWRLGYRPSKYFDLKRFCYFNNVSALRSNPLVTFILKGKLPGYDLPTAEEVKKLEKLEAVNIFNDHEYKDIYPDVAASKMDPKIHYVRHGWIERRAPCRGLIIQNAINKLKNYTFDTLLKCIQKAIEEKSKQEEFRRIVLEEGLFSEKYYLETYSDIKIPETNPIEHFYCYGVHEKRQPYPSQSLREELERIEKVSYESYLEILRKHSKKKLASTIAQNKTTFFMENNQEIGCRQIDVLIVVRNYQLPSAIWRSTFFCESLCLSGIKAVVRSESDCLKLIPNTSIVFLQKFTNIDESFLKIFDLAKSYNCEVWGDMDDLFHPKYIKYSGQALSGLWNAEHQKLIANGFLQVISELDALLVSTPKLKQVFSEDFPKKKILLRRNKIPHRYLGRRSIKKNVGKSFKMIYSSGSLSHKKDFEPIADIMYEFLRRFKDCSLTLLGGDSIQVPSKLLSLNNVKVIPAMAFEEMIKTIEVHDLMLVPLLKNDFNNAKSNIKFIEAAAVKVPVLTTSVSEFSAFIDNGVNGFLEDDFSSWGVRLLDFHRKPEVLSMAGEKAHFSILKNLTTSDLENKIASKIYRKVKDNIEKRYPNKSNQKYPNWLLEQNRYVPLVGIDELINRVNSYIKKKQQRGNARYVVYTCLSNNYDTLKIPEFLDDDVDYVCFSDNPIYGYGIWEIKSYSENISDPIRISRHPKLLPHLYLSEYEASLYLDANIIPVKSMSTIFTGLAKSGAHIAGVVHPWRKCIYQEAEACKMSEKDSSDIIDKAISFFKSKGFPEEYGLYENNLIYRKHNEIDVIQAMELWWQTYSRYSRRDQLSFMFALFQTGLKPCNIFVDPTRNVRNSSEFLYFSHGKDDIWSFVFNNNDYLDFAQHSK